MSRKRALSSAYGRFNNSGLSIPRTPIERFIPGEKQSFKFIAWNVNSLRTLLSKRSDLLVKLWKEEKPAVLGLMETKIGEKDEDAMRQDLIRLLDKSKDVFSSSNLKLIFSHSKTRKGYSGTCLIIDLNQISSVENVQKSIGHKMTDDEGRVISVTLPGARHVVLCYSPNSGQNLERLELRTSKESSSFDQTLADYCRSLEGQVILMGDLNVAFKDKDIYNVEAPHIPKSSGTTDEERQSFEERFLKNGFIDSFDYLHPNAEGWFSYWSVRAGNIHKNRGLRLDYVLLLGKQLEPLLKDAFMLPEFCPTGDHCPIGITILSD